MIELLTTSIRFLSFWTKELKWGLINSRCDSIGDDKLIVVDVNKLKDDVLKRGDSQLEVVRNDGVEETWKGESEGNLLGDK